MTNTPTQARQQIATLIERYRALDEATRKITSETGVVHQDDIDGLVAHLYGLRRDEFAHILGAFPLVFPDTPAGQQKQARLLAVHDGITSENGGQG